MPKTAKKTPSKSAFIRKHPSLSAAEVVAKAKEAGISVTPTLVYKVRGRAKAKGKVARKAPIAKKAVAAKQAVAAPASKAPAPKTPTASDFIRTQPKTMPAAQVVKAGAAKGIKFSANLVYAVRSASAKKMPAQRPAKASAAPKIKATGAPSHTGLLSRLVIEHGIGRVREMLAEVERRVERVLSGG